MALLPQERHKQIALLAGFLALAGLYAFFDYWYAPRAQEVEELQVHLEQLQDQNRRAQLVAARGGEDLEERVAVYERHVRRLEELIPESEEVPSLLRSIGTEARRARVEPGSIRPEPSSTGEFYSRQTYEMSAVGEYHDVGRFLAAIASLPRIITPVDLEITAFSGTPPAPDVRNPVVARFRIQTYVIPDGTGESADAAEAEEDR